MGVRGRLTSSISLTALAVASGLAAFFSVEATANQLRVPVPPTGDPGAAAALIQASIRDLASGSFLAHVESTIVSSGRTAEQSYTVVYQAPDSSELIGPGNGPTSVVITVGHERYARSVLTPTGPQWLRVEVPAGQPRGASMATTYLTALERRTDVVGYGDRYKEVVVSEAVPGSADAEFYGVGEVETTLKATVVGGRVVAETLVSVSAQARLGLSVTYGAFGTAPGIAVPADARQLPYACPGTNVPSTRPCR